MKALIVFFILNSCVNNFSLENKEKNLSSYLEKKIFPNKVRKREEYRKKRQEEIIKRDKEEKIEKIIKYLKESREIGNKYSLDEIEEALRAKWSKKQNLNLFKWLVLNTSLPGLYKIALKVGLDDCKLDQNQDLLERLRHSDFSIPYHILQFDNEKYQHFMSYPLFERYLRESLYRREKEICEQWDRLKDIVKDEILNKKNIQILECLLKYKECSEGIFNMMLDEYMPKVKEDLIKLNIDDIILYCSCEKIDRILTKLNELSIDYVKLAKDPFHYVTPYAKEKYNYDLLELLLKKGFDLKYLNQNKQNILYTFVEKAFFRSTDYNIKQVKSILCKIYKKYSKEEFIKIVNNQDRLGKTALFINRYNDRNANKEIQVRLLLGHPKENENDENLWDQDDELEKEISAILRANKATIKKLTANCGGRYDGRRRKCECSY